jgi:hypothetical protein
LRCGLRSAYGTTASQCDRRPFKNCHAVVNHMTMAHPEAVRANGVSKALACPHILVVAMENAKLIQHSRVLERVTITCCPQNFLAVATVAGACFWIWMMFFAISRGIIQRLSRIGCWIEMGIGYIMMKDTAAAENASNYLPIPMTWSDTNFMSRSMSTARVRVGEKENCTQIFLVPGAISAKGTSNPSMVCSSILTQASSTLNVEQMKYGLQTDNVGSTQLTSARSTPHL